MVLANENACYKRNELEYNFNIGQMELLTDGKARNRQMGDPIS